MMRHSWTVAELRAILDGLAILAPQDPAELRGFALAVAAVATILGLRPNGQQLTDEMLKSRFATGF